mmetsp:Transcript_4377/g.12334  ORF Transcript_4377/g.12334 Transcript_4377/m.12334 type:complete len:469 (-) Transcript_4377:70-1476(-)
MFVEWMKRAFRVRSHPLPLNKSLLNRREEGTLPKYCTLEKYSLRDKRKCLSHGTALLGEVGLGTLGKLRVEHSGVNGEADGAEDEEGESELLATGGLGAAGAGGNAAGSDNDVALLAVGTGLEGGDVVAHLGLLDKLVLVGGVLGVAVVEAVGLLALGGSLVKLLADLHDLGLLLLLVVVVVVVVVVLVLVLLINDEAGNGGLAVVGGLEKGVGELHGVAIVVLEVLLDVHRGVKEHALLVGEDADLDLLAAGAVGASEELLAVLVLVDGLALEELGGIDVAVLLHVLDLVAGIHALAVVVVVVVVLLVLSVLGVLEETSVVVLAVLLALLAHGLLGLLGVLDHGLEVVLHHDGVLAVVVGAVTAGGAELKDDEALGAQDGRGILVLGHLVVVHLDELALLEAEGVAGDVGHVVFPLIEHTGVLGGLGAAHEAGHVALHGLVGLGGLGSDEEGKSKNGVTSNHIFILI